MNYEKIYYQFLDYFKTVSIENRLKSRNKYDERLKKEYIYCEVHHIIPKSLNGSNNCKRFDALSTNT